MMDLRALDIRRLRWDDWNRTHIARPGHEASPEEVEYVVFNPLSIAQTAKEKRVMVIGPTQAGRILAAVIEEEQNGIWYCVSARTAKAKTERAL